MIHSESDLAAAIQAAAGRPVVLDFYADWWHVYGLYCKLVAQCSKSMLKC